MPRNINFRSNPLFGKKAIPKKTLILEKVLKEFPKPGEIKKYSISKDLSVELKRFASDLKGINDYFVLKVKEKGDVKKYFVKEISSYTKMLLGGNTYNEFIAQTHPELKKELQNLNYKVLDTFYGFENKKTGQNFVVTKYLDPKKYQTLDYYRGEGKMNVFEYNKIIVKLQEDMAYLHSKGFLVFDLGPHNLFVNLKNPKELIIFDFVSHMKSLKPIKK